MILELFGLPGSGKSTLRYELVPNSDFVTVKIKTRLELVYYSLLSILQHPLRFFKIFKLIKSNSKNKNEFYYKFMNCLVDYSAKMEKAKRKKYALLDQGYFQNIISLFDHQISKEELEKYLKMIPRPDHLVVVQVDEKIRQERLSDRDIHSRTWLDEAGLEEFDKKARENFEVFLDNIESINSSYIILNNKSTEELVGIIKNRVLT